jgi:hypothetical protein
MNYRLLILRAVALFAGAEIALNAVAAADGTRDLENALEEAVMCKRPLDVSAHRIVGRLRRLGMDTRRFDENVGLTWRYALPPGTTVFGEPARFVVIDNDVGMAALDGTLYVELGNGSVGDWRLKRKLKLDRSPFKGYREYDFSQDRVTRFYRSTPDGDDMMYVSAIATSLESVHKNVVVGCQHYLGD